MGEPVEDRKDALVRHAIDDARATLDAIALDAEGDAAAEALRRIASRLSFAASLLTDHGIENPLAVEDMPEPLPDEWTKLPRRRQMATVLNVVGDHFGLSRAELCGARRDATLVPARLIAMYLASRLVAIGRASLGGVFQGDGTTIARALRTVGQRRRDDAELAAELAMLRAQILGAAAAT
jgi:chromosomal replication initiation ATPase DnaA